jgi:hypothetical protein
MLPKLRQTHFKKRKRRGRREVEALGKRQDIYSLDQSAAVKHPAPNISTDQAAKR